jgi:hypothetical protein
MTGVFTLIYSPSIGRQGNGGAVPSTVRQVDSISALKAQQNQSSGDLDTWSNGMVEGKVNRIKFLKRQMFARAKFDLLRLRILAS